MIGVADGILWNCFHESSGGECLSPLWAVGKGWKTYWAIFEAFNRAKNRWVELTPGGGLWPS